MQLELLAPAADKQIACAAIDCGADAVYIGGPRFGARAKVGNSILDLEQCVKYAHFYGAKVYVTLNTLIYDNEWEEASKIAKNCYEIGVDALIVQDMGWLELDLPPIELHASTQCNIRTAEKAEFLHKAGFSRLVLARELSVKQIGEIRAKTNAELEAFIHGALCVSYSGRCYLSQALFGRSGNRGECAQACRLPYNLCTENGNILCENKHLLSLKDLSAEEYINDLITAGVCSFKIEGRLKDICYVKNVTAYYRKLLDSCMGNTHTKSSDGKITLGFEPDLQKAFHRPYTTYNLSGERNSVAFIATPKAMGEYIGEVLPSYSKKSGSEIVLKTEVKLSPGDGLCALDKDQGLIGFGINAVSEKGDIVYLKAGKEISIAPNTHLYRNQDIFFENKVNSEKAANRKIGICGSFYRDADFFVMSIWDKNGTKVNLQREVSSFVLAENEQKMRDNFITQMKKIGDYPFFWLDLNIDIEPNNFPFIPIGEINAWRRCLLDQIYQIRIDMNRPSDYVHCDEAGSYPVEEGEPSGYLDYRANISNKLSRKFYLKHGQERVDKAFELIKRPIKSKQIEDKPLMQCKYCIKFELKQCSKYFSDTNPDFDKDLHLSYKGHKFALHFDCKHERMEVRPYEKEEYI